MRGSRSVAAVALVALAALVALGGPAAPAQPGGCATTAGTPCTFVSTGEPARVAGVCRGIFASASFVLLVDCSFQVRAGSTVLASCSASLPALACTATSSSPVPAGVVLTCRPSGSTPQSPVASACTTGA